MRGKQTTHNTKLQAHKHNKMIINKKTITQQQQYFY